MPQVPHLSEPYKDKKAPVGVASIQPSLSLEKTAAKPVLQFQSVQLETAQSESDKVAVGTAPCPPSSKEAQRGAANPAPQSSKEERVEDPAPADGMKSRFQKLAEQRKCWDTNSKCFALLTC